MKIPLSEIWNFSELIGQEEGWSYSLIAGSLKITDISQDILLAIKSDPDYDTELLPSIFTFREILWQPDVFTEAGMSLPGLRILQAFCEETIQHYEQLDGPTYPVYSQLLAGLTKHSGTAVNALQKKDPDVKKVLGDLRKKVFPVLKFFIYHPQNRLDYYRDAVNRLNYAVKIMLTQFHGRYTDLQDPFWEVNYDKKASRSAPPPKGKSLEEE